MGNDGGSIPKRRELVKEAARNRTVAEVKESQQELQEYYWSTDPISQKPLAQPVVSDCTGKLYNKVTIVEYLVEGSYKADAESITRGAMTSLKDVVEVKFEDDADAASKAEVWKCPVTGERLDSGAKAAYLVPCGHAFSGVALKEVSSEKCIVCETEYAPNDVIPILPTSEADIARLLLRIKTLKEKGLTHSLKKVSGSGKKRKKREEATDAPVDASNDTITSNEGPIKRTSTNGVHSKDGSSGIKGASTASLAAKVVADQKSKRIKTESDNVRSLFSSKDQAHSSGKNGDFMTRGFSIPSTAKR